MYLRIYLVNVLVIHWSVRLMLHCKMYIFVSYTKIFSLQVIFFVRECVRSGVGMADMLCFSLMRQIAGGDVSPKNLWLAEQVLGTFAENRAWFLSFPILLQTAVYTFLRIIVDHQGNASYDIRFIQYHS